MESIPHCPHCGSDYLWWRVRRISGRVLRQSRREIHWRCRGCDGEWTAPIYEPADASREAFKLVAEPTADEIVEKDYEILPDPTGMRR